uniref:TF-B3 domain-containing protein n=1 Tax=Arundo donax TaxID=35708 RepID=A0A0A9G8U8_ARUDO
MNTVCEVCGDIGYKHLLVCCRDCMCSAMHQYCLDKVVFDASLADWLCYECLQSHGEVTLSSSQHDNTKSLESNERFVQCQKGSSCGKTVKTAAATPASEESGEDIPSENESLELDNLQAPPGDDYVLSRTSYLSEAQKERVMAFIQETKPKITVFVSIMRKSNVQPPGPCLGISKEYASAHFPHKSTNVTLQMPGKSKQWHPIFYKRNESRKNMLMGQWLEFVRDNHVQEGDICLLGPTKGGRRTTFTVYLLRETTHSRCGSIAKMASEVHIKEELSDEEISGSGMHEISHGSLESEDYGDPSQPPYIVPCGNCLSKSQKKIVEERVRAIQSEVPICVAVMKNNNVGIARKWMLELGSRYASVHLPARGQTMVLQCGRKIWEVKMVIHNGQNGDS